MGRDQFASALVPVLYQAECQGGKAELRRLLASLSGYRAMPSALQVGLLGSYWLLAWNLLRQPRRVLQSRLA